MSEQYRGWQIKYRTEIGTKSRKYFGAGIPNTETEGYNFGAISGPRAATSPEQLRRNIDADPDTK